MADIESVWKKTAEEIAEGVEWEYECPGQESMGPNENLKAMLNYYIGEEDNYAVDGAVISCDQMSDKPVYIERKGNRIIISGEREKKVFEATKAGQNYVHCYDVQLNTKGVRGLSAVHATDQTAGKLTFATVSDCTCSRDEKEKETAGKASIVSLGNCRLVEKGDAEKIEKRKEEANEYGTCYCLIRPDEGWVNPYCMESVTGECHDNGGLNAVLPSAGVADILMPRISACRRIDHHSTMKWSTANGLEEGLTMFSTLLCTRGGIITIKRSGQVKDFRSEMKEKGFPDIYIDYLEVLHEKYPLWEFEADITGVSYEEFLKYQIDNKEEWKCAENENGTVKYCTGDDFPGETSAVYRVATDEAIRFFSHPYSMLQDDPFDKGFQNAMQFFRIDQPLSKEFVQEVVPKILEEESEEFINAVVNSNGCVNPLFIACMAGEEKGPVGETYKGKKVYNYFNIGAYGANDDAEKYAYDHGWFTMEDCIAGSMEEFQEYLDRGQDTLYQIDWDYKGYATGQVKQYATLVNDAECKAIMMCKKKGESFDLNQPFVFCIPVYTDIPIYKDNHLAFIDPNHTGNIQE